MPTHPDSTSLSLLNAVRTGSETAWQRLVDLYHPLVYSLCRRWWLKEHDAENVGQEVFVAIYRGIGDFRREQSGDTFRGWVRRICRNKYVDWVRTVANVPQAVGGSSAHRMVMETPDDESEESASLEKQMLYRRAVQLIESNYSARDWSAFQQVVIDGHRPSDVAKTLGIDVNVVYLAKSRILARLREEFGDVIGEDVLIE